MDNPEAAHLLGVAESEVRDVKSEAGWWHALHHDMASHQEQWRKVIQAPEEEASPDGPLRTEDVPDDVSDVLHAVPDGSAKDVLAWVGEDPDRAAAASLAEEQKETPRVTLLAALEKIT
jgi:hypothetical protein